MASTYRSHSAYDEVNRAWKTTAKVILGGEAGEIGELDEYDGWLSEYVEPVITKKSSASGKDVYFADQHYCDSGSYVSLDEVDFNRRFEPLGINEVKDIDSIAEALKERFCYCGNIILENSKNIEKSSNINGSHYVYKSNYVYGSEYVVHCSHIKNCKYVFTDNSDCGSSFLIRCLEGFASSRCFETWRTYSCSDCYFTFGVEASRDVMFSFNLKNAQYAIGNLTLPKDSYLKLKAKLLEEVRAELVANKRLPSLIEMAGVRKAGTPVGSEAMFAEEDEGEGKDSWDETGGGMAPIEAAFSKTTQIVLGKKLAGIKDYENWLMRNIPAVHKRKSAVSGREIYQSGNLPLSVLPADRLVTEQEARKLAGLLHLEEPELRSFGEIRNALWKIAFFMTEARLGETRNVFEAPLVNSSLNCYKGGVFNDSENCACCFWPRNSKYMFGSQLAVQSSHCLKAYNSVNLTRAFEVDGCGNCSDVYFAHNCENVQDSMFCFNTKNLRNAIGNATLPMDRYRQVKAALLAQIVGALEKDKNLDMSVFNIGCR